MSMNGTASTETIEGQVVSENAKGIRLDSSEAWVNYSRFADVPHPTKGQRVRVEVGGDGFIRKLVILGGAVDSTSAPGSGSNSGSAAAPDRLTLRLRVLEVCSVSRAGPDHRRVPTR